MGLLIGLQASYRFVKYLADCISIAQEVLTPLGIDETETLRELGVSLQLLQ
jgi:hypothetical protein